MDEESLKQIDELLARRIGVLEESFQHKLDLVVEGQQALSEKIDRVEINIKEQIRQVDQRVTGIGADLSEHRADTEAHRKGWRVRED